MVTIDHEIIQVDYISVKVFIQKKNMLV